MTEGSQIANGSDHLSDSEYEFIDGDNVTYRRRKNKLSRSVDDVFNATTGKWLPYKGDRFQRGMFGSITTDPAKRK